MLLDLYLSGPCHSHITYYNENDTAKNIELNFGDRVVVDLLLLRQIDLTNPIMENWDSHYLPLFFLLESDPA